MNIETIEKAYEQAVEESKNEIYESALEENNGNKVAALNALQGYDSFTNFGTAEEFEGESAEGAFWVNSHGVTTWLKGDESFEQILKIMHDHIG